MLLDLEEDFIIGQDTYFDSVSPTSSFGVTFEDNLITGYFYAVDTQPNLQILDALHIYNVADVIDKDKPSKIKIVWTEDGQTVSLLIDNSCHAIFDFKEKAGYCLNGFPENNRNWAQTKPRILTDDLVFAIFNNKNL